MVPATNGARFLFAVARTPCGQPVRGFASDPARAGQSLIESCLVIAMMCLIFMGLFQISQIFAARQILHHAATRGARAQTVGFNWWMVEKCVRVASIPNAGKMTRPGFTRQDLSLQTMVKEKPGVLWDWVLQQVPHSEQSDLEIARAPEYLASETPARARAVLDYEDWDTVQGRHSPGLSQTVLDVEVQQRYLLRAFGDAAVHRAFWAADSVDLGARCEMESYYPIYLDDKGW